MHEVAWSQREDGGCQHVVQRRLERLVTVGPQATRPARADDPWVASGGERQYLGGGQIPVEHGQAMLLGHDLDVGDVRPLVYRGESLGIMNRSAVTLPRVTTARASATSSAHATRRAAPLRSGSGTFPPSPVTAVLNATLAATLPEVEMRTYCLHRHPPRVERRRPVIVAAGTRAG